MTPKIVNPTLAVVTEDADGTLTEYIVQTDNRDAVRFERIMGQKNANMETAPILFMTGLAWSALLRSQIVPQECKFDTFAEQLCVSVGAVDKDTGELIEDVDQAQSVPTLPAASAGS